MMESCPEEIKEPIEEMARKAVPILPTVHLSVSRERIENDFSRHKLDIQGTAAAVMIRDSVKAAAHLMNKYCPSGRELSSALTKLEEAMFHATAGIARKGPIEP